MIQLITYRNGNRKRIWSEPVHNNHLHLHRRVVLFMWGLGTSLALTIGLVIFIVGSLLVDNQPDASASGLLTVAAGFGSALGFLLAGLVILPRLREDRVAHALAAAVVHLATLMLLLFVSVVVYLFTGNTLMDLGASSQETNEIAVGLFAVAFSGVTGLAGCLLASAAMPSMGPVPKGTQPGPADGDRTL